MMNRRPNALIGVSITLGFIALAVLLIGYFGHGRWVFGNNFWPMHNGYYGHGGMMGYGNMGIVSLLFWGALIIAGALIFVWFIGNAKQKESHNTPIQPDALEILKQRYARGEIDREQFVRQRETLMKTDSDSLKK